MSYRYGKSGFGKDFEQIRRISRMQGGLDSWSLSNYSPPGYNDRANVFEKHAPWASYEGPGTNIDKRWVQKGLHGTTAVDEACRHHDIQYWNLALLKARSRINQQQLEKGIANADKRLLAVANRNLTSVNPINNAHAWMAEAGIRAKRGLQDMGLLNKAAFTSTNKTADARYIDEDAPRYEDEIPVDYLQGKGRGRKKDRLKELKKVLKKEAVA